MEETSDYWNTYYAEKERPSVPSQFASFVLNEFGHKTRFVDIGCGDGRDSVFFAHFGKSVLGVDGSMAAVDMCRATAERRGLKNAEFKKLDLSRPTDCDAFLEGHVQHWRGAIVYARFFIHAIDEAAQDSFLGLAAGLAGRDGHICLEFRTPRDEYQTKVTSDHYRRFVDPLELAAHAHRHGLTCTYAVEGFGFAKFRADDAHVARMILARA